MRRSPALLPSLSNKASSSSCKTCSSSSSPPSLAAWNSRLRALVRAGRFSETTRLYRRMIRLGVPPDNFTYPPVLKACSASSDLPLGREIHDRIRRCPGDPNPYVRCALIDMYAKCGSLPEARLVFDDMHPRDLVSWTAIICATTRSGHWSEALHLFRTMMTSEEGACMPDSVIMATLIPACGRTRDLRLGTGMQGAAVKRGFHHDLCVSNALIDMYCKCGDTQTAHGLFRLSECRDVISWTSLIAGYCQNGKCPQGLGLLREMMAARMRPGSVTLASILPGIAEMKLLRLGKEVHCYAIRCGLECDTFISSALIDLYCTHGSMRQAEYIFEIMSNSDIAIWNSMIMGYALNEKVNSAFDTVRRIGRSLVRPNSITIITLLPLCNQYTMLDQGKELHGFVLRVGLGTVVSVNNALIDMYCKCGCLDLGKKVFEQMVDRDVVTYNTIIAAFGMHSHGEQAILFFEHMKKEGVEPDKVTFIALISACSHAGLTDMGAQFYNSMIEDYGILPDMEHHSCMVDLYGRSGYLEEAWGFIQSMPVEPGVDALGSLLGACRVHKRTDLAELVGKRIFEQKHADPGYHILLSNIYAAAGRWEDAKNVRTKVNERGFMKKPGNSRI